MADRQVEERVLFQRLKGGMTGDDLEYTLEMIKNRIEKARRDGQLAFPAVVRSRPGIVGKAIVLVKKFMRWGVWWYISPLVERQNRFNEEVASALKDMLVILNRYSSGAEDHEGESE